MNRFIFFRNYYEAINDPKNELTEEEQGKLYNAIFAYMFDGKDPDLHGACRMAFNLIKVSLDLSKARSEAGRQGSESRQNGKKAEANDKQTGSKTEANDKQTGSKRRFACDLPLLEEERRKKSDETLQRAPAREDGDESTAEVFEEGSEDEGDGTEEGTERFVAPEVAAFKVFLKEHPDISVDITNPGEICSVDWNLLGEKISESRILKPKRSLHWLIRHYREIVGDSYRDYDRSPPSDKEAEAEARKAEFLRAHPWAGEG